MGNSLTSNSESFMPEVGLTDFGGEPRVRDLDLAERLGFKRLTSIRVLIDRKRSEFEAFGPLHQYDAKSSGGRPGKEYWLTEEQALLASTLSDAQNAARVRHMLIKVFVAWRRGHLVESQGVSVIDIDKEVKRALGGIMKGVVHKELTEIIPSLVRGELAARSWLIRRGNTAGDIWRRFGLPRLKNGSLWLGNRLAEMGCSIEDDGRADINGHPVRLFDPDKAAVCMKNGLLHTAKTYASERQGQGRLRLVQ